MKFVLLGLLQERPMHGYEMIKALEEKSGGFYSPSPGSIYPTLQMLEEGGYVSAQEVEGKKVYHITDTGHAMIAEREQLHSAGEHGGPPWMRRHAPGEAGGGGGRGIRPELMALRGEAMEVARLFAIAGRMSFQDPQQIARLRTLIEHTRAELQAFIYTEKSPASASDQPPAATEEA